MKKFKVDVFSKSSIKELQKELTKYKSQLLSNCKKVVKQLAEIGKEVIEEEISKAGFTYSNGIESGSDTEHDTDIKITSENGYARADIIVSGEDIVFIEFGAGVYYNGEVGSSPHPKGDELGFLIGSYGKGLGAKKVWGYTDENNELVLTHGTKATMPLYKAYLKMYQEAPRVVAEVFSSNK